MPKLSNFSEIKVGDYLSETQYYQVTKKTNETISVINERAFEFQISHNIVEEGILSASQFNDERIVIRSELVSILENAKDTVFTVNFHKLPNEKSLLEKLQDVRLADLGDSVKLKKLAKSMNLGEERTLIGHLNHTEPKMGRSSVTDLEIPIGHHRNRLIDHRTLNWMIINNIKYRVR